MHLEIARAAAAAADHFAKLLAAMHERYKANDITPGDIRATADRELFDWTGKRPTTTASTVRHPPTRQCQPRESRP